MSVILIDEFQFSSVTLPGTFEVYKINFNNASTDITVIYTGNDGQKLTVTELQRGRASLSELARIISDDGLNIYVLNVSLDTPFAYRSSTIPNTPAPPTCDLAFTSVNVTAETQQGLKDGTITAVATTSFNALQYSINGTNWFTSGVFTNLSPGNYVVQARDSNACLISRSVAVEQFSNPISGGFGSGLPVFQVSANNISKWSATYNPIVINFQRNDNSIYSVADAGSGYVNVTINGIYNAGQITLALAGLVIVKGSKYKISQKAFSVTTVTGRSVLRFLSPYFGADTGVVFIEQSKPNYKIEVVITTGATIYETNTYTGTWSPDLTGFVRADLAAYLQSLVNANDRFAYDVINWKDPDRGASYTITYREVWDGSDNPYYNAPYPLYAVYAAMRLGEKYGGNMAEYVPFYNEPNADLKAKFMTDFVEPKFWVGLPWDISFIYSESIVGQLIKLRTTSLDLNKKPVIGGELNSYLINSDAGYITASDTARLLIKEGALPPVDEAALIEALGVNRLMMPGNPGTNVEYLQLQLYRGADAAPFFVTKPIIVKAERPCDSDPYIYLKWINHLGGWNYWRFGYRQDYSLTIANETQIKRPVFNWATDQTINDAVKKTAFESIEFGESGISLDYITGLKGLPEAIRVQMLVSESPMQWHTVEINPGSFRLYSTRGNLFEVKFSLNLPDKNIQRQ